jgi:hypothetical protein
MFTILIAVTLVQGTAHDRAFWKGIEEGGYAVPAGESPAALIRELSGYLGSPDKELRDDFAYSIPARWIYEDGRLDAEDLRGLLSLWSGNLATGIGERGTDSVLLRSFSALDLSLLAAYDLKRPFMSEGEFHGLLETALSYIAAEKDTRGYDEQKGWMHSAAHTADLLKFLARNPRLRPAEQPRIVEGIRGKLAGSDLFIHGEDQRLAAALLSLVRRPDFDPRALETWVQELKASEAKLWDAKVFDHGAFFSIENQKNCLRGLGVRLAATKDLGTAAKGLEGPLLELGAS